MNRTGPQPLALLAMRDGEIVAFRLKRAGASRSWSWCQGGLAGEEGKAAVRLGR